MAFRFFPGTDKAWLQARLQEVIDDEVDGAAAISAASGDVNSTSSIQLTTGERKRRILYDLQVVDPDSNWQENIAARVTRGVFNDIIQQQ